MSYYLYSANVYTYIKNKRNTEIIQMWHKNQKPNQYSGWYLEGILKGRGTAPCLKLVLGEGEGEGDWGFSCADGEGDNGIGMEIAGVVCLRVNDYKFKYGFVFIFGFVVLDYV